MRERERGGNFLQVYFLSGKTSGHKSRLLHRLEVYAIHDVIIHVKVDCYELDLFCFTFRKYYKVNFKRWCDLCDVTSDKLMVKSDTKRL